MAERYSRLYSLPENQYTAGAPVLIAAGALLKDNQTGKALAQLKFKSIYEKQIKAVKVGISAFDVSGKELEGVSEYQYLDLNVGRNAEFGQKQAVTLPDAVTRSFKVKCTDVFFADGSAWCAAPDAVWNSLPAQETVSDKLGSLAAQYQRDTSTRSKFIPVEYEDLWFCSCGALNSAGEDECHACKQSKEKLFAALNLETLDQRNEAYKAAEAEKAAKQAEADKIQSAKTKKFAIIAAAVVAVIVAVSLLVTNVIIPSINYNKAVKMMEAGQYTEAIAAFEAMDGYKDSIAKIEECNLGILDNQYADAVALMEAGQYTEAIVAFEALNGHKDSISKIDECNVGILDKQYEDAVALMEAGETAKAAKAFYRLGTHKNAKEESLRLWGEIAQRDTISAGFYHTVGLKADGTVVAVGDNDDGQCNVDDWTDIIAISAGDVYTVGLKADGTVVAVGDNDDGQCNVDDWTDIIAISAGWCHTVGLKADGTVVAVGDNDDGQCNVDDWTDIIAISAGGFNTVGLKADGTVVAVGHNDYGQCDVGRWRDIVAISAGRSYTVALKADGTVVAVGNNKYGQRDVGSWTDIVAISTDDRHTVGLKADGTVVAVGYNNYGTCDVNSWTDIVAVSAGQYHTVGLKADGTVVAIGGRFVDMSKLNVYRIDGEIYYSLEGEGVVDIDPDKGQCDVDNWTDIRLPKK